MTAKSQPNWVRTYVLPCLLIFALPAFALWFSGYVERSWDAEIVATVQNDGSMNPAERAAFTAELVANPPHERCTQPGTRIPSGLCGDYAQMRYAKTAAGWALGLGLVSVLVVLLCGVVSLTSRGAQYAAFAAGWQFMRVASTVQTVLQTGLAVWLSFWITAYFFNSYFPKLIFAIGLLGLVAVVMVVRAIFARTERPMLLSGETLARADAPEFFALLDQTCAKLETTAPETVIVGIDDNFFVTEHDLALVSDARPDAPPEDVHGRTLYVSLSLLGAMSRGEAHAVLAHEMAHFSGGDTEYSRRLSPMLQRFEHYTVALFAGGMTIPVGYFMDGFRGLMEWSLSRERRERELRADRLAAEVTDPSTTAAALLKVSAYAGYRSNVERGLFEQDEKNESLGIAGRVASGFEGYVRSSKLVEDLRSAEVPHPFDSHPTLDQRASALGVPLGPAEYEARLLPLPEATLLDLIPEAQARCARMWEAYEALFDKAHEEELAHRYVPETDAEREHVLRFFPGETYTKSGGGAVTLTYEAIHDDDWEAPIRFAEIVSLRDEERRFSRFLDIRHTGGKKRSIKIGGLDDGADVFMHALSAYYGRHKVMEAYQASRAG